jgi:hypothetical protein
MQTNDHGDIRGIYVDEDGPQPRELKKVDPGTPLMGDEVISLSQREGAPFLDAEVTTINEDAGESTAGHSGPCRVNSKAYRDGWDRIFGNQEPAEA